MSTQVKKAALTYAADGLSIIPVNANKTPIGKWKRYQTERAAPEVIEEWYGDHPEAGVAVICGTVSGGVVVMDVDDEEFVRWLLESAKKLLAATWVVRTGSGKLHIYARSKETCLTTVIKGHKRYADIRADGVAPKGPSYVVAPPSPYLKEVRDKESGAILNRITGKYETIHGDSSSIMEVEDAIAFFSKLARKYDATAQAARISSQGAIADDGIPDTQDALGTPVTGDELDALTRRIKEAPLNPRLRRTIFRGADPSSVKVGNYDDHSTLDFHVISELAERGFSYEDIRTIYSTYPIGNGCYRNPRRKGSTGEAYLKHTMAAVKVRQADRAEAISKAQGDNFEVLTVTKLLYEEPEYQLQVVYGADLKQTVKGMTIDDLTSEGRFMKALAAQLNFIPVLKRGHTGKDFINFSTVLMAMVVEEAPPTDATQVGMIARVLVQVLKDNIRDFEGEENEASLGWKDEKNRRVFFRAPVLLTRIQNVIKPQPQPKDLWHAISNGMGGCVVDEDKGLWTVPIRVIQEEK